MTDKNSEKLTDAEMENVAGGGGKLSEHDSKKIEMMKNNAANDPDITPAPDKKSKG